MASPLVRALVPPLLLPLLAALVTVMWGCGGEEPGPGRGERGGPRPGGQAAIPVRAENVEQGEIVAYIPTYARLETERWVNVVARTSGLVTGLAAEEGDRVEEGEVLARLDQEELALRVEQVEVALEQARATHDRTETLHARALVSEEELEAARHQLDNARVTLKEARLNLAYAHIRAPLAGVVMLRHVEVGDMVHPNQEVFAVADLEPLLVRIQVPEKRMHQIREGQEARIIIDSLPGRRFGGRVRMISPLVGRESGTVKVTLEVPETLGLLKPGMFARVEIITEQHPRALIIPKKALILETDEDDVFVLEEGKARRQRVELGFTEGDRVEVLSGLAPGDQVITVGQEGLRDGQAVRIAGADANPPRPGAGGPDSGSRGG